MTAHPEPLVLYWEPVVLAGRRAPDELAFDRPDDCHGNRVRSEGIDRVGMVPGRDDISCTRSKLKHRQFCRSWQ